MYLVQEVLVSSDVMSSNFLCKLTACQGACCRKGDFGAPLNKEEMELLDQEGSLLAEAYLPTKSKKVVEEEGFYKYYPEMEKYGTTLREDGGCVFLTEHGDGIESCGIEKAHKDGFINLKKPISCHLYPIRIEEDSEIGYTAMNYDRWEICEAACGYGDEMKVPLIRFAKDAIIRRFSHEFYEELDYVFTRFSN